MKTSEHTRRFGLIGHPVEHSLSPFIMNRAFAITGIDGYYTAIDIAEPDIDVTLRKFRSLGLSGASVTYPYKARVMEIVDHPSLDAGLIGAANTLKVTTARVDGFNTDADGTALALEKLGGVSSTGKNVLVVGAGGAGRAAGYGLLKAGAARVTFAVRTPSKVARFVDTLSDLFPGTSTRVTTNDDADPSNVVGPDDIIINATPAGMTGIDTGGNAAAALDVTPDQTYFDLVYHPLVTPFLERARVGGARTLNGLALLVAQAQIAFKIWTGHEFSIESMYSDVIEEYARTRKDGNHS